MSDARNVDPDIDRSGIHVPREIADDYGLPEDLDANLTGAYDFPSPQRRRRAAAWYFAGALLLVTAALAGLGSGLYWVAIGLTVLGLWHFAAAWPLELDEQQALRAAVATVPFPIGHASAAVRFRGWRSKPIWHVVIYDATEPPAHRALVRVDAVDGTILDAPYVEDLTHPE